MSSPRRTSVIVLITLAELAWLAAFGLLFAYRSKVGELGKLHRDLVSATNRLAQVEARYPDANKLFREVNESLAENQRLRERLAVFEKSLGNVPPEEAARRLAAAAEFEKKIVAAEERQRDLQCKLTEMTEAEAKVRAQLATTKNELAKLRMQLAALPPNAAELNEQLRLAQTRVTELEKQLLITQTEIRHREVGEFSIRRELTGLPDGNLRRVIFIMDTSTSMRNSPAWDSARKLIRTWLEFLPVEECALVNFNDSAIGFPKQGYLRVRQPDGTRLVDQQNELLRVFDQAGSGTFTDLMRGLRRAYEYPPADVMVLFTDGEPHVAYQRDSSFANDIFNEVAKHRGVPILTVGLGSYEVEDAGGLQSRTNAPVSFLKKLAHQTGGNFLGR